VDGAHRVGHSQDFMDRVHGVIDQCRDVSVGRGAGNLLDDRRLQHLNDVEHSRDARARAQNRTKRPGVVRRQQLDSLSVC
jgi:hypothetical protein